MADRPGPADRVTPRLHLPALPPSGVPLTIEGAALRHLRALRLKAGERLVVFDGHGGEREFQLTTVGTRRIHAIEVAVTQRGRESPLALVLCPALLKGAKMDFVVEKATELGVHRIAPIVTRHGVGRRADVERWRRLVVAAAMQSGRTRVPEIDPPAPFAVRVAEPWPQRKILCWEGEDATRLRDLPARADAAVLFVGPEGGFAAAEVQLARTHGFTTVCLGQRLLRAETAAIAATALAQHRWGDA